MFNISRSSFLLPPSSFLPERVSMRDWFLHGNHRAGKGTPSSPNGGGFGVCWMD